MGALPIKIEENRELPDYLPARMVNEFAYCPRLFFYEWVEGLFAESVDTVEGSIQHRRVDAKATVLPDAVDLPQSIHSRSVQLSSERLRVIAKMDLVEVDGGVVTPVDYKHGRPREGTEGLELWPSVGHNWRSRESCCGRTDTGARKASRITARRSSGCVWRSTKR
jgi:CRISP-associated protein Cas1